MFKEPLVGQCHPWQKASSSAPQRSDQPQNLGQFGSPSSVLLGSCARPSQQIELSLRQSSLFVSEHASGSRELTLCQWQTGFICQGPMGYCAILCQSHQSYLCRALILSESSVVVARMYLGNKKSSLGCWYILHRRMQGSHKNWKQKRGTSVPWSKHGISHVWSLHHHEGFLAIYNWYLNPLYYITMGPDDHPRLWLYK